MRLIRIFYLLLQITWGVSGGGTVGSGATVTLETDWPSHRLAPLMEASEFVGEAKFWDFVESTATKTRESDLFAESSADAVDIAVQLGSELFDETQALTKRLLKLAIELRAYSPAIEQQRQLGLRLLDSLGFDNHTSLPVAWAAVGLRGGAGTESRLCFTPEEVESALKDFSTSLQTSQSEDACVLESSDPFQLIESDHVHPRSETSAGSKIILILHGVLGTRELSQFHSVVTSAMHKSQNHLVYALRYFPLKGSTLVESVTKLQGFGVTMDIKNMEYITVDEDNKKDHDKEHQQVDVAKSSSESSQVDFAEPVGGLVFEKFLDKVPAGARESLLALRNELVEEEEDMSSRNQEIEQIKVWDMVHLGTQTAWKILQSTDPLERWLDIAGNFPQRAKSLIQVKPSPAFTLSVKGAHSMFQAAPGLITINGIPFDLASESFNIFSMLDMIKQEAQLARYAKSLQPPSGTSPIKVIEKATMLFSKESAEPDLSQDGDQANAVLQSSGVRLNYRADAKGAVVFLNNIEKDHMYSRWPTSLQHLLQQSYQIIPVKKNLYTTILALDPANKMDRSVLGKLFHFMQSGAPIRFGVVFAPSTTDEADPQVCGAACFVSLFLAAMDASGREVALQVIQELSNVDVDGSVSVDNAVEVFARASAASTPSNKKKKSAAEYKEIALASFETEKAKKTVDKMKKYVHSKGIAVPSWSLNGLYHPDVSTFQSDVSQQVFMEQRVLAFQVHFSKINDRTDVFKHLLTYGKVVNRINTKIQKPTTESTFLPVVSAPFLSSVPYLYEDVSKGDHVRAPVTLWLLVNSKSMLLDFLPALKDYVETTPKNVRIAVLPMSTSAVGASTQLDQVWAAIFSGEVSISTILSLAAGEEAKLNKEGVPEKVNQIAEAVQALVESAKGPDASLLAKKGSVSVVCNGRIIPFNSKSELVGEDYSAMVTHERATRTSTLGSVLVKEMIGGKLDRDFVLSLSAVAGLHAQVARQSLGMSSYEEAFSDLLLKANPLDASAFGSEDAAQMGLRVEAVLDPLEEAAPRIAAVLKLLRDSLGASIKVFFIPNPSVSKFPISSFFRFVANTDEASSSPEAGFHKMPQEQLLTLKISTPEPWIVYALDTDGLDTDNIMFSREKSDRYVRFTLKSLLVTGHCYDTISKTPPQGLQLQLTSQPKNAVVSDTLVMRNLGYWQLQASPGVWKLEIAPGPSHDLYMIESSSSFGSGSTSSSVWYGGLQTSSQGNREHLDGKELILRDFVGHVEQLMVKKRPGKEKEMLLENIEKLGEESQQESTAGKVQDTAASVGWFDWLKALVFGASGSKAERVSDKSLGKKGQDETIHVFSLASGALYERFLRIMMVSVKKQTQNPVKFWLIENFLSPDFKVSIPKLAKHYGFEYSLVTYKWPHWLRRQTEKQRIIWGYKILFLDVLFPLNVPKVIYVDADQVVRTDLKELWEMDLQGMPYGYTPFCQSREETSGFRFWDAPGSYWRSHLRGKPYHISALYVVDLKVFRKMMVGDRLRAVYDQLSRDPNSLANLDQDLPNYAQHMVPIFSLPQEWLWCESWCSDASKAQAKTIDLCNNPLHKEPKLDMAKRVISGDLFQQSWIELDEEIKSVIN